MKKYELGARLPNIPNYWKDVNTDNLICVYDIQNGNKYYECADYDPATKKTYFGGRLVAVPPLKSETVPNETDLFNYIDLFEKRSEFLYMNYIYHK